MIADARTIARWPDARIQSLAELAIAVSDAPWTLSPAHHDRARRAGLSDDDILHAIALAAYFGHLNRIADAVAVPLDYEVRHEPPHAEPATPALHPAPTPRTGAAAIALDRRPATAAALAAWRDYLVERDPANKSIAGWVGGLVGEAPLDAANSAAYRLVERVTLAPWQLGEPAFADVRAEGYDDLKVFDLCAAASSFGVFSRIQVALLSLGG